MDEWTQVTYLSVDKKKIVNDDVTQYYTPPHEQRKERDRKPKRGKDSKHRKKRERHQFLNDQHDNDISVQSDTIPNTNKEKERMILSGQVNLVHMDVNKHKLQNKTYGYGVVTGHFCPVDWEPYRKDPSSFPMFRHVVNHSCNRRNTFEYDLKRIAELAADDPDVLVMDLKAFVFHESRCGSTLVANSLTAMDTKEHRVYSESKPLVMAMEVCGFEGMDCPPDTSTKLIQDVVRVMGLTGEPTEKGLFYKVQSIGARYMSVALEAFPETPWIFVYREPVQVMMSHLKLGIHYANCIYQLRDVTAQKIEFLNSLGRDLDSLSPVEKCACHLSLLCDAAVEAISRSNGVGIGVNYQSITNTLINTIFPDHFKLEMTEERKERIIEVSGHYSKGKSASRGKSFQGKEWKEDSERKEERASPAIKEASELFLSSSYAILNN